MVNDELIAKNIKGLLKDRMQLSSLDINVDSKDGHVTLSGIVDVLAEKVFAEETSKSIDGVVSVENCLTVATDSNITDSHIQAAVEKKLREKDKGERLLNVGVEVKGGTAVLMGSVMTLADREEAIHRAQQARGVSNVISNLTIETAGNVDDATINNNIARMFKQNDFSIPDIFTKTENGVVHLGGHVRDRHEMELAEEIAMNVEGVREVINKLQVRKKY